MAVPDPPRFRRPDPAQHAVTTALLAAMTAAVIVSFSAFLFLLATAPAVVRPLAVSPASTSALPGAP